MRKRAGAAEERRVFGRAVILGLLFREVLSMNTARAMSNDGNPYS